MKNPGGFIGIHPQAWLTIIMFGFFTYLLSPIAFWVFLLYELDAAGFPPEADSIGIPMGGFLILWGFGWLVFIAGGVLTLVWRLVLSPSAEK